MASDSNTMTPRALTGGAGLLLCVGMLSGCATTGDIEQVRQEAQRGETELRAELTKDQSQLTTLAKENEALRASHAKVSKTVKEYLKAEEARHLTALEQVRAAMKALE